MVPAIPTKAKLLSDTSIKLNWLISFATKKPEIPPIKSDGAKIPPTPPAPLVTAVATAFRAMIRKSEPISSQ